MIWPSPRRDKATEIKTKYACVQFKKKKEEE